MNSAGPDMQTCAMSSPRHWGAHPALRKCIRCGARLHHQLQLLLLMLHWMLWRRLTRADAWIPVPFCFSRVQDWQICEGVICEVSSDAVALQARSRCFDS